jgi:hypothetical protein
VLFTIKIMLIHIVRPPDNADVITQQLCRAGFANSNGSLAVLWVHGSAELKL